MHYIEKFGCDSEGRLFYRCKKCGYVTTKDHFLEIRDKDTCHPLIIINI